MKLNYIKLENWKCFTKKEVLFNENLNILNWPNGVGKSSTLQAIAFLLFGKRPDGLSFDSLRNNLDKQCKLELGFTHNFEEYIIKKEFGKKSVVECTKNGELVARSAGDLDALIEDILPQSLAEGLWGNNSLALSPILKTDYLFDILETEFKEPLNIKQYFLNERSVAQKQVSSLKKTISGQEITEEEITKVKNEIDELEKKIKSKVFVDDADVVKAKQCKVDYPQYMGYKEKLNSLKPDYDIELARRLNNLLKSENITTKEHWDSYFSNIEKELQLEKSKSAKLHPLTKYPKSTVASMIKESEESGKCIFCGGDFHSFELDYNQIDLDKIEELEDKLKDKQYDFDKIINSATYYGIQKKVNDFAYLDEFDWKSILEKYDEESKQLYNDLETKKEEYEQLKQEFAKVTELLKWQKEYDNQKENIAITEQYINEAKQYYSNALLQKANEYLEKINPRYSNLHIDEGIYKVLVYTEDYSNVSYLPIMSLSAGEKIIMALILILSVRDLFASDIPLIMDECFVNLDKNNLTMVEQILKKDSGQWLIVSHDINFAEALKV